MSDRASARPHPPGDPAHHLHLQFVARPSSAAAARRQVTAALGRWGWQECTETAALLVSELVANAVRHGRGPVELSLSAEQDALVVRVTDASPHPPQPPDEPAGDPASGSTEQLGERGRGLVLVEALATAWGWTTHPGAGKEVWFRLARDQPPADQPPADQPPADQPPADQPPADQNG